MPLKTSLPASTPRLLLVCFLLALSLFLLSACTGTAIGPCRASVQNGIETLCGFKNPEDIRRLPDQKTLLISEVGILGKPSSGSLKFFDTQSKNINQAFPFDAAMNQAAVNPPAGQSVWGASNCPGSPGTEFSPLGISVQQRSDGRWQVAAVNHGQRQSIEMFELIKVGAHYGLEWRGCVIPPEEVLMNSVTLLRNGGFLATHMFDRQAPSLFGVSTGIWKSQLGIDTGYVFEWQPEKATEFRILAGSHGPFLNGIELSADEASVFFSVTSANEIRKLDRVSGKLIGSTHMERPDNLSWDSQGFLLAASLTGSRLENFICIQHTGETCGLAFQIYRIDPKDMSKQLLFAHEGAPMGAATVAQPLGDALYLGSFTGDRILKIPYPPAEST
ncbi:hypothetical protein WG899_16140 [Paucibacter sp. AS339]|uniref:hypothetical protein n=1 Tax=Paucibacter hankyongi TaxID=3133434 RepID=UPI0030B401EB